MRDSVSAARTIAPEYGRTFAALAVRRICKALEPGPCTRLHAMPMHHVDVPLTPFTPINLPVPLDRERLWHHSRVPGPPRTLPAAFVFASRLLARGMAADAIKRQQQALVGCGEAVVVTLSPLLDERLLRNKSRSVDEHDTRVERAFRAFFLRAKCKRRAVREGAPEVGIRKRPPKQHVAVGVHDQAIANIWLIEKAVLVHERGNVQPQISTSSAACHSVRNQTALNHRLVIGLHHPHAKLCRKPRHHASHFGACTLMVRLI
mmetsp:Transcript_42553/g.117399  ORF Transcript_42553/g.117399 Transcript_42553/m.117399 type:complete len:262 (-) Transcript_42553:475-1260(-)